MYINVKLCIILKLLMVIIFEREREKGIDLFGY